MFGMLAALLNHAGLLASDAVYPGTLLPWAPAVNADWGATHRVIGTADGPWLVAPEYGLLRLLPDGTVDPTFENGLSGIAVLDVAADGEGGWLVSGTVPRIQSTYAQHSVVRILSDGSRDDSFGTQTVWRVWPPSGSNMHGRVHALHSLGNGRVLIAGEFAAIHFTLRAHLAVLDTSGTVVDDLAFGHGVNAPNGAVHTVLPDGDGWLIGGEFTAIGETPAYRLARLHADGSHDNSWSAGHGANGTILQLARDPGGRIVAIGRFTSLGGKIRQGIARLQPDGAVDLTFDAGGGIAPMAHLDTEVSARFEQLGIPRPGPYRLAVNPDGAVIINGRFGSLSGWPTSGLARLRENGAVDTQWSSDALPSPFPFERPILHDLGEGLLLMSTLKSSDDGYSEVLGQLANGNAPLAPPEVTRAPAAFPLWQKSVSEIVYGAFPITPEVPAGTGVMLSAGVRGPGELTFRWFHQGFPLEDGPAVSGSDRPGLYLRSPKPEASGFYHLQVTSSLTGSVDTDALHLSVLPAATGPGKLDLDWAADRLPLAPQVLSRTPDGGLWAAVSGQSGTTEVYRLDSRGRLMPHSPVPIGTRINGAVTGMAMLTEGRLLVAGSFTTANDLLRRRAAILDATGIPTSELAPSMSGNVRSVHELSDGRILLVLAVASAASTGDTEIEGAEAATMRLLVLHADGTVDSSYDPEGHGVYIIHRVEPTTEGRTFVLGRPSLGGDRLMRLLPDGTVDPAFPNLTISAAAVTSMIGEPDGSLLIAGSFSSQGLSRMRPNGTFDPDFGSPRSSLPSGSVEQVIRAPDGHLYLLLRAPAGASPSYGGFNLGPVVRLSPSGIIDTEFQTLGTFTLPTNPVVTPQLAWHDNGVLLFGDFYHTPRDQMIRIQVPGEPIHAPVSVHGAGNRLLARGASASLYAMFTGGGPMTYEWRIDGELIEQARGPQLELGQVGPANAGTYTVTAVNSLGSATVTMEVECYPADPMQVVEGLQRLTGFPGEIRRLVAMPDGSVIMERYDPAIQFRRVTLTRMDALGQVDPHFDFPGSANSLLAGAIAEPGGTLLVLGTFSLPEAQNGSLLRLNPNGSVAQTLHPVDPDLVRMARQPDGSIILIRRESASGGTGFPFTLVRVHADGSPDASFLPLSLTTQTPDAPHLAADVAGNLILAGRFSGIGEVPALGMVWRVLADGSLDPTWVADPSLSQVPARIWIDRTGRVFAHAAPQSHLLKSGNANLTMVRFEADGSVDLTWQCTIPGITTVGEDSHGILYVATVGRLYRLLPHGGVDRSVAINTRIHAFAAMGDRLFAAGGSVLSSVNDQPVPGIAALATGLPLAPEVLGTSPTTVTSSAGQFVLLSGAVRYPEAATFQWYRNGEPLAGATSPVLLLDSPNPGDSGSYHLETMANGVTVNTPATHLSVTPNLHRAGEVDLDWAAGHTYRGVSVAVATANGAIGLAGEVRVNHQLPRPVVMMDQSGNPAAGFELSPRLGGRAQALLHLADSRLLVGGHSLTLDGSVRKLVRVHAHGEVDSTFALTGTSLTGFQIRGIVELDGGAVAVLDSTAYDSGRFVVIGNEGIPDHSKTITTGRALALLRAPDGERWLVANIGGRWIHRLLPSGVRDPVPLDPLPRSNETLISAILASDGGLLVHYRATPSSNFTQHRILRLDPAGAVVGHLPLGRFDNPATLTFAMAEDSRGRVILAGNFQRYDGVTRKGLVRLLEDGSADPSFAGPTQPGSPGLPAMVTLNSVPGSERLLIWADGLEGYAGIWRGDLLALHGNPAAVEPAAVLLEAESDMTATALEPFSLGLPAQIPSRAQIQWFRDGQRLDGETSPRIHHRLMPPDWGGYYHATISADGNLLVTQPTQVRVSRILPRLLPQGASLQLDRPAARTANYPGGRTLVHVAEGMVNLGDFLRFLVLDPEHRIERVLPVEVLKAGARGTIHVMLADSEGRVYLGGDFDRVNGLERNRLARVLADGTLDTGWDPGIGPNGIVTHLALHVQDRLLVGGAFTHVAGQPRSRLARLLPDASLDFGFIVDQGLNNTLNALHVQEDSRIVIGGTFTTYRGTTAPRLIRLLANGSLDTAFAPAPNSAVADIAAGPDGTLLVAGSFTSIAGETVARLARLRADGSLDPAFSIQPPLTGSMVRVAVDMEGRIVAASTSAVLRYLADGSADPGFPAVPITALTGLPTVYNLVPTAAGVLVAGTFWNADNRLCPGLAWLGGREGPSPILTATPADRVVAEGGWTSWSGSQFGANSGSFRWTSLETGEVLSTINRLDLSPVLREHAGWYRVECTRDGITESADFQLIVTSLPRPLRPGQPILDFRPDLPVGASSVVEATGGGHWIASSIGLRRLLPDGTVELAPIPLVEIRIMIRDASGRLYLYVDHAKNEEIPPRSIVRLRQDGSLDPSFTPYLLDVYPALSRIPSAMVPHPDGGIVLATQPTQTNSSSIAKPELLRLGDDGFPVHAFFAHQPHGIAHALAWQSDGRLLVAGSFTGFGSVPASGLVRLESSGTRDLSFVPADLPPLTTVTSLPDGRILIGGAFRSVDGMQRPALARLHANGLLDTTFIFGGPTDFAVTSVVPRPDGRLMVCGTVAQADGRVMQLLPDGGLDPDYDQDLSLIENQGIHRIHLLPDGRMWLYQRYQINLPGLAGINSLLLLEGTTLVSGRLTQEIDFPAPPDRPFTLQPMALDITASSGLPIQTTVLSGPATITPDGLVLTGTGEVVVQADQGGDATYLPATPVTRRFAVLPGVNAWRAAWFTPAELANPTIGNLLADPDGDGRVNLLEYALGSSPFLPAGPPLTLEESDGAWILRISRPAGGVPGVSLVVEVSTDHHTWSPVPLVIESTTQGRDTLRVTLPAGLSLAFARIRVEVLE